MATYKRMVNTIRLLRFDDRFNRCLTSPLPMYNLFNPYCL